MNSLEYDIAAREIEIMRELVKHEARHNFQKFVSYTFEGYDMQWFHKCICYYLDKLYKGDIKKLMIFVPPQHGKSELSSRRFPAYLLGRDPNLKLALCSYSADLSSSFNRAVQMIIDDPAYEELYEDTRLNGKRVSTDTGNGVLRNSTMFEIVGHKGFLKTVGVGGSLTGTPVDIGIIDDPFKDRAEANSATYRNNKWAWYQDVFCTRLHNDSKQLMLFTRWHEDDLAGRLLDPNNPCYDAKEASEWTVIALPALKEEQPPLACALDIQDPRSIGEALWEKRHSREKYEKRKRINPTGFASLDQQRPAPLEGGMIKTDWFNIINRSECPFQFNDVVWDAWIDGAWTEKASNDPTAVSYTYYDKKTHSLYIRNVVEVRKELNKLMKYLVANEDVNGMNERSLYHIEMKASGAAIKVLLHQAGWNTKRINNKHVSVGKVNRVEQSEPFLAAGRVFLIRDERSNWIDSFLAQCKVFPNGTHDDKVDVLTYPILNYFLKKRKRTITIS